MTTCKGVKIYINVKITFESKTEYKVNVGRSLKWTSKLHRGCFPTLTFGHMQTNVMLWNYSREKLQLSHLNYFSSGNEMKFEALQFFVSHQS